MGFEIEDFPFPLLTALICNPQTRKSFQNRLYQAYDRNCDAFISPIFSDQYVKQMEANNFDLDQCFILSGKISLT